MIRQLSWDFPSEGEIQIHFVKGILQDSWMRVVRGFKCLELFDCSVATERGANDCKCEDAVG